MRQLLTCLFLLIATQHMAQTFDLSKQDGETYSLSVPVADGNYRVTVMLGSRRHAGSTTIRGESRRLFIENVPTRKREMRTVTFTINKRNTHINDHEEVCIKPRERSKLNWDDQLTLEVTGDYSTVQSITIEPDTTATTLFLCGNSTVVDQDEEPWASWGQMITRWMDEGVAVANYAESGETASTFLAAGRLKKALTQMKLGDYIFMEFGHNDQKQRFPGAGAYYNFATALKTFIDEARAKGAHPILVTPTQRRSFRNERIEETHADYPDAIWWLAEREQVPVVDLHSMTRTLFEAMGEEGSKRAFVHYPAHAYPGQDKPLADNTHFNPYGAYQIAKCMVEGLRQAAPALFTHIRPDYAAFDPAHPDPPSTFHWTDSKRIDTQKPDGN